MRHLGATLGATCDTEASSEGVLMLILSCEHLLGFVHLFVCEKGRGGESERARVRERARARKRERAGGVGKERKRKTDKKLGGRRNGRQGGGRA